MQGGALTRAGLSRAWAYRTEVWDRNRTFGEDLELGAVPVRPEPESLDTNPRARGRDRMEPARSVRGGSSAGGMRQPPRADRVESSARDSGHCPRMEVAFPSDGVHRTHTHRIGGTSGTRFGGLFAAEQRTRIRPALPGQALPDAPASAYPPSYPLCFRASFSNPSGSEKASRPSCERTKARRRMSKLDFRGISGRGLFLDLRWGAAGHGSPGRRREQPVRPIVSDCTSTANMTAATSSSEAIAAHGSLGNVRAQRLPFRAPGGFFRAPEHSTPGAARLAVDQHTPRLRGAHAYISLRPSGPACEPASPRPASCESWHAPHGSRLRGQNGIGQPRDVSRILSPSPSSLSLSSLQEIDLRKVQS